MSYSWLQRKRKGELIELARDVNLDGADSLLKDDLITQLAEHLEANESTYGKHASFADYYRRASPVKRERSSPDASSIAVAKPRRRTIVKKAESEEPTPEKALVTRTPRTVSRTVQRVTENFPAPVDIPASPSQLAEVADQSFRAARDRASQLWTQSRTEETIALFRENASSVVFIQFAILFIEGAGLEWNTLKTFWLADTPAIAGLSSKPVSIPDFKLLFTNDYWGPATLWSLTSWILPLFVSYFFNLTLRSNTRHKSSSRQYTVDPFTFNIARALLAWLAYSVPIVPAQLAGEPNVVQAYVPGWGPFAEATVGTVRSNVPGGYTGLQIGSLIGLLYSLYDAALKK